MYGTELCAETEEVCGLKRLMAGLLAICLVCAGAGNAFAAYIFEDVPHNAWYEEAVAYVTENGYFNGVDALSFDPMGGMTRGMFITVLGRMAGVSEDQGMPGLITRSGVNLRQEPNTSSAVLAVLAQGTSVRALGMTGGWYLVHVGELAGYVRGDLMTAYAGGFTDVPAGKYYSPYVEWAVLQEIVSGVTAETFAPEQLLSREQLCAILYNFMTAYEVALPQTVPGAVFADDQQIAPWAKEAVYALQGAGVLNGRSDNAFVPKDGATRAEVAVILKRFIDAIGQENIPNASVQFGVPVPETAAVTDSYFDDACFIGHSMVVGMSNYFRLPNADFYAVNGISASGLLKYEGFSLERTETGANGQTYPAQGTLAEALEKKTGEYSKVYIMLGTNELGPEAYHVNSYAANMGTLIDLVRESQPTAKIYVIATLPVSQERSEEDENFNRENIQRFNTKLLEVSSEKEVYYLDAYSLLADADGYLPADSCLSDGIHILAPQYAQLKAYLKTHIA